MWVTGFTALATATLDTVTPSLLSYSTCRASLKYFQGLLIPGLRDKKPIEALKSEIEDHNSGTVQATAQQVGRSDLTALQSSTGDL